MVVLLALMLAGCGWLDYPRLGIHQAIWSGGQADLDAGRVVQYTEIPATDGSGMIPLEGIWLAGHRTSHGAVFAALPGAQVGDDVVVNGNHYRVRALLYLPHIWVVRFLGALVLQTSLGGPADPVLAVVCDPA